MSGFAVEVRVRRRGASAAPFLLEAVFASDPGITVVFGPSGAGKTSLLLAVLGALRPEHGRIEVAGRVLFDSAAGIDLSTRARRVGMVFQDALLFPHLTARDNVAFGVPSGDRTTRAEALLARVGAAEFAGHRPDALSGGQRQRVALARALAAEPAALLLDEPFSALDAASRDALGRLLLELHAASGIPFLYVTHDLGEALRLGNRLLLMEGGRVVQAGTPAEVIARPATLGAARALGTENLFQGRVVEHRPELGCTTFDLAGTAVQTVRVDEPPGSLVTLGLRAEDILLSLEPLRLTSARNVIEGRVEQLTPRGHAVEVVVATPTRFRVIVTGASVAELRLEPGRRVWLLIKAAAFHRVV